MKPIFEIIEQKVDQSFACKERHQPTHFKTRTGKTLPDFVNELRVGRACRMLAEAAQPVTEIALACGFANLANFHRQFRQRMRLTPRDYRSLMNRPS